MRHYSSIRLLALLLSTTTTTLVAQTNPATDSSTVASPQPLKATLLPSMQQTMVSLNNVKLTGDPDFDYVRLATVHTRGTQTLLNTVLTVQRDSALTQAVQTMLSTAQTELTTLGKLQTDLKPTRPNAVFAKQQKRILAAMREKLKQSASTYKLTRNPATNIYLLLRDQWQDTSNLATNYLLFGKNTELRNAAQQSVEKAKLAIDVLTNLPNRRN